MSKKVSIELTEHQMYYVTKILGTLTERRSLGMLDEALDMATSKEDKKRLEELIKNHRNDEEFSFEVFDILADQLEVDTGISQ